MSDLLAVSDIAFEPASSEEAARGHLGWISFSLGGELRIDSVQLRLTRDRRLALSFPGRRSRMGGMFRYVTPLTEAVHKEIEQQVLRALRLGEAGGVSTRRQREGGPR